MAPLPVRGQLGLFIWFVVVPRGEVEEVDETIAGGAASTRQRPSLRSVSRR